MEGEAASVRLIHMLLGSGEGIKWLLGVLEGVILKGQGQKHEKAACVWTHKSEDGACGEENIYIRGSTQQADGWEDSPSRSPTAPIITLRTQWAREWSSHAAEVEATYGPNSKGSFPPSLRVTVLPDA